MVISMMDPIITASLSSQWPYYQKSQSDTMTDTDADSYNKPEIISLRHFAFWMNMDRIRQDLAYENDTWIGLGRI